MKALITFTVALFACHSIICQKAKHPSYFNMSNPYYSAGNFLFKGNLVLDSINSYTATDSLLWNKLIFENDSKGNRKSVAYYSYNSYDPQTMKSIGLLLTKYEYEYNDHGKLLSCREKLSDEPYLVNTSFEYNKSGQLVSETYTRTFDSITWDDFGKLELIYNQKGLLQNEIHIYGNDSSKTTYIYDSTSWNLLNYSHDYFYNGQWVQDQRNEFKYGSNNKISTLKSYQTNGNPSIYLAYEATYLYDDTTLVEMDERSYEFDGSTWYAIKTFYFFKPNEKKIVVKKLANDIWENMSKKIYSYNDKGEESMYEEYYWDHNTWIGLIKNEPEYLDGLKNNETSYYQNNQEWKPNVKSYYFYSSIKNELIVSMQKTRIGPSAFIYFSKANLHVQTNADKNTLTIYSLEGRRLLSRQIGKGNTIIGTENLKGIYIIQLSSESENKVQKVIIR